jgi:aspartate aminotransferase
MLTFLQTYSAGGWRIGYAIFPDTVFGATVKRTTLAYASECWSAASAPAQEAAAVAFDTSPEMDLYRTQVTRLHRHCTTAFYNALVECGLAVAPPKGAFYLYPSFHPYAKQLENMGIRTSQQLSHWLVEECGIAALPGSAFGEDDEGLQGGRYRLRMATSYLFFENQKARYTEGYKLIENAMLENAAVSGQLPMLGKAIDTIKAAVKKVQSAGALP